MRGLQGVAGALLTPAALATITAIFVGEERGAAIGSWTAWTGIAILIGPVAGGWLVHVLSWRAIFFVNLPLVVATFALIWIALPARPRTGPRPNVDWVGGLLCVFGLGGPVFALIEAPTRGFGDPLILFSLLGGIALLVVFVLWEQRHTDPMLPLRLFRRRNFTWANIETFSVYAALSVWGFFLVLFLQQLAGYSPVEAGAATVPTTIVMFLLSPRVGRLSMRFGPRWFMVFGPFVCAISLLWMRELSPDFSYWTELFPAVLVFSLGLSLIVAPLTSTVLADAGEGDAGIASGVNNATARVAGLLGIAVVGAAIAGPGNELDLSGYRMAMGITAALIAAGGVIGLVGIRNPGRRRRPTRSPNQARRERGAPRSSSTGSGSGTRAARSTPSTSSRSRSRPGRSACSSARPAAGRRPR